MKRSSSTSSSGESPSSKWKRLSIAEKREVIQLLKGGSSTSQVAQHYRIGQQTVRDIKKKESELDRYQITYGSPSNADRKSLKRPKTDNVDRATYTWFKAQRAAGAEVNSLMLQMKAQEFNKLLGGPDSFKSSNGWLSRFLSRHGIRMTKTAGESGEADLEAALEYCSKTIPELLEEEQITLSQLYNGDETGLIYRKTLSKTYTLPTEDKHLSGRKQPKEQVTLLVGSNASGTDKLPLIMIGKFKNPRCFNKINPSSIPLTYLNQKKAWVGSALFKKIVLEHCTGYLTSSSSCRRTTSLNVL